MSLLRGASGSKKLSYIPTMLKLSLMDSVHVKVNTFALVNEFNTNSFAFPDTILSQFFILAFLACNNMGNFPNSRNTPIFVVCFCTPRRSLRNVFEQFQLGYFLAFLDSPKNHYHKVITHKVITQICKTVGVDVHPLFRTS